MLPLVKIVLPPNPLFSSPLTNNFPFLAEPMVCQSKIYIDPIRCGRMTKFWPIGCKMKGCLQFPLSVFNEGSSLPRGFFFSARWDGYQKAGTQAEGTRGGGKPHGKAPSHPTWSRSHRVATGQGAQGGLEANRVLEHGKQSSQNVPHP